MQMSSSVSTSILTQSSDRMDLQFFLITSSVLGLYFSKIFVMRAVVLLDPMYAITAVPRGMGNSSSSAIASITNLLVTGTEYLREDSTFPNLIVSK